MPSSWMPFGGGQQKPAGQQQGAVPGSHWMPYQPPTMSDAAYGAGANSAASQAGSYYGYLGQSDQARYGAQAAGEQAKYGYMGQEAQARYGAQAAGAQAGAQATQAQYGAQAAKDQAAFGALGNLGIAGLNAIGQYGTSRNNALMNQSVAAANAYNQMAAADLNTRAQLGQSMAGMAAAAGQAGADTNKATALGGLGQGMVNAGMYGAQMAPYTAGNLPNFNFGGFGGGGGGGFQTSGPEGGIASGRYGGGGYGGGGRRGGNRQQMTPPPPPYVGGGSGQMVDPYMPFNQGSQFLGGLRNDINSPNSFANRSMGLMTHELGMNRAGIMDNSVLNSLNANVGMGYDAIGRANSASDYGFNTGYNTPTQFANRALKFQNDPAGWYGSFGRFMR